MVLRSIKMEFNMQSNFRKKIILLLALLSSQTYAAATYQILPCNYFYVGGVLGIAGLADKESTNNPFHDMHYLGASGVIGGALVGYNFQLQQQWQLGLEGFINGISINIADNQNYAPQTSYTVNMRYNFGIRALPAYEFTPQTSGHIVLGYTNASFKINDNGNYGTIYRTYAKNGFQTGVGMETFLMPQLMLRSDVLYSLYASQNSNGLTTALPQTTQVYRNHFSSLEAELSIVYII